MESLSHCIYASAAAPGLGRDELDCILAQSRNGNARLGITGMLLCVDGSFFQVLEGERGAVDGLFRRISADRRHSKVTEIIREPIEKRVFGDWTMGYSRLTVAEARRIDGLNDFFEGASCFSELGAGRAKKLLAAFAAGRWRTLLDVPARSAA